MRYPLSEVFDRFTIETRKARYGADNAKVLAMFRKAILEAIGLRTTNIVCTAIELAVANCDIANLEWAIRANAGNLPMEEIGRRALVVRDINTLRVEIRNRLAGYLGEWVTPDRADRKEKFTSVLQVPEEVVTITAWHPNEGKHGKLTVQRGKGAKTPRTR